MLVNLSYQELMQISAALTTIETVYGTASVCKILDKVNACMEYMDNAPVTEIYPGICRISCEGVGTVTT